MASFVFESSESGVSVQTSTPEYRTMRKCYVKLIDLLKQSIGTVGDVLFAEEHISEYVRDTLRMDSVTPIDKARKVVDCMMDRVKHRPGVYNEFVMILEKQGPWTKMIVDELNTCYESLNPKPTVSVTAKSFSGFGPESEATVPVETKSYLPERVRSKSKLIRKKTDKLPAIYELNKKQNMVDKEKRVARLEIGEPVDEGNEKLLMVVGPTGSGKTTLINGIANHMYGIQWDDDFRFVLVNEPQKKTQAHSQTSWITAYTLYRQKESPIPYSLTIIDTPGFGNTEGIERDKKIVDQIKDLFSIHPPNGVDVLHGICLVVQASWIRFNQVQKYMLDSILSVYGRDVASNIFMMCTFADGLTPPVLEAIKVAKIPHQDCFKFNNSALFGDEDEDEDEDEYKYESLDAIFWQMSTIGLVRFFSALGKAEHRSLQLTREVLNERQKLESVLKALQPQIHAGLTKMHELQRAVQMLQHKKQEEDRSSAELKDRYDSANKGESRARTMIAIIKEDLKQLEYLVLGMVDRARKSLMRLDEIALKPNPLSEVGYIDQLIVSEQQQCKFGWQERVKAYAQLRERAALVKKIKTLDPMNTGPLFSYLGEEGAGGTYCS